MGYLFEEPIELCVTLSIGNENDLVLLSLPAYTTLFGLDQVNSNAPIAIHISPRPKVLDIDQDLGLTCWCRLDEKATGLIVPSQCVRSYPWLSPDNPALVPPTCYIYPLLPTPLTKVVFAIDRRSGSHFTRDFAQPETQVDSHLIPILRQGSYQALPSTFVSTQGVPSIEGHLILTEPVLHGSFDPLFTVLFLTSHPSDIHSLSSDEPSQNDEPEIEISEDFLQGLLPLPTSPQPTYEDIKTQPKTIPSSSSSGHPYNLIPLDYPLCTNQDDTALFVRTRDLSEIGALQGEWVIVRTTENKSSRLTRLQVDDSASIERHAVYASPVQVSNILRGIPRSMAPQLILQPTSFGTRKPPVPLARSITVSRVASPISVDRGFEAACIIGLRRYLRRAPHIMKQGDIITVLIDTDHKHDIEEADISHSIHPENYNETVYYIVQHIEYDLPPQPALSRCSDAHIESVSGELGCWIDHPYTRVVQAGVEHSIGPVCANYFGMNSARPLVDTRSLKTLLDITSASLCNSATEYHLQPTVLIQGPRGTGKTTVAIQTANEFGLHFLEVDCYSVLGDNVTHSEAYLRTRFEKAASCSPCILLLKHIDALAHTSQPGDSNGSPLGSVVVECIERVILDWKVTGYPVLVFATAAQSDDIPKQILSAFKHQIQLQAPDEQQRSKLLSTILSRPKTPELTISDLASESAAFAAGDLVALGRSVNRCSISRVLKSLEPRISELHRAIIPISKADVDSALRRARASHAESIGTPQIPNVSWDDVGGISDVKAEILDTIQLPLDYPEMFASGLKKRSGILLYGPPGTGKTLLAKAVATSFALNFFSVKGPELLNMYIGESEANVRRVFQRAKDARPCVVFFDELDSIAPKRGNHGDSGGVMDRIVSQLLAELDGVSSGASGSDVFVIGATNRPDLLDPALLRPGRFDRLLYLGVSDTNEAQLNILRALTRKFKLHPDLRLEDVIESCPFNFTGADFYALSSDALMRAMSRKAEEIDALIAELNANPPDTHDVPYPLTPQYYLSELAQPDAIEVVVSQDDFRLALQSLVPSVSPAEMEHYRRVQRRFSGNGDT